MLTFDEFCKLTRAEQNERYRELSDHDKFLARMNDCGGDESAGDKRRLTVEELTAIFSEKSK